MEPTEINVTQFNTTRDTECLRTTVPKIMARAIPQVVPQSQLNPMTIDGMRHRSDSENGTMEFLFLSMFQYFQE